METGVKLLVHAKLPAKCPHANHDDGFEVYDKQYFTLTGHRVPGTPATINDRVNSQVEFVISKFVAAKKHERNGREKHQENGQSGGNLDGVTFDHQDDITLARSALAGLSATRAEAITGTGCRSGWRCHSVGNDLLADWDAWSRTIGQVVRWRVCKQVGNVQQERKRQHRDVDLPREARRLDTTDKDEDSGDQQNGNESCGFRHRELRHRDGCRRQADHRTVVHVGHHRDRQHGDRQLAASRG